MSRIKQRKGRGFRCGIHNVNSEEPVVPPKKIQYTQKPGTRAIILGFQIANDRRGSP